MPLTRALALALAALGAAEGSVVAKIPEGGSKGAGWQADAPTPVAAVNAMLGRLGLPAASFDVQQIPLSQDGLDTMQLSNAGGKVVVRGSSGVAMASAVNWYLNDWCNTTYDWNTYSLQIPKTLPLPDTTAVVTRTTKWSYYMNVCTYGYSLAFVDWAYWEKHIDWMAMNGINLPLAFVGQEWIWQEVFAEYGLTFDDLGTFFSGPAFLPWFRMGNMRAWGGAAFSESGMQEWVQVRGALQKRLLARMRGFGMTAVLSAFAGHVPKALIDKHPEAKYTRSPDWAGMPEEYGQVYMLDPSDELFTEIGNKFIAKQAAEWGTDHVYNCDTYNEMEPANSSTVFLQASARAVLAAMTGADSSAVWLMQGWLFHESFWKPPQMKAYLTAVPDDRMWVLDLNSEASPVWTTSDSFYGKPFIWCTLLVYGGQQGIHGDLISVLGGYASSLRENTTVTGVGITMEGIWTNYPMFEATLLMTWQQPRSQATAPEYWASYARRRYGQPTAGATAAWNLLGSTIYSGQRGTTEGPIERVPSTKSSLLDPMSVMHPAVAATAGGGAGAAVAAVAAAAEAAAPPPPCTYTQVANSFLYDYAPGYAPGSGVYNESSLASAQAWCCAQGGACGGVTFQYNQFQARVGCTPKPYNGPTTWYKPHCTDPDPPPPGGQPSPVPQVWKALLSESATLASVPSYRMDLVDITREQIESNFSTAVDEFHAACAASKTACAAAGATLLSILDDYDAILSSDPNFMLGPWIAWARSPDWTNVTAHKDWLEFNARNQITMWGPSAQINDYAAKSWGGLVRDYYKPRWQLYISMMTASEPFDPTKFSHAILTEIEQPWSNATAPVFPVTPEHDAVQLSQALYTKYIGK